MTDLFITGFVCYLITDLTTFKLEQESDSLSKS